MKARAQGRKTPAEMTTLEIVDKLGRLREEITRILDRGLAL